MPRRSLPRSIPSLASIQIRPISDLRNKSLEISKLVHKSKSPVFITRKGREDMVLLSIEQWEDLYVYPLLLEAELDEAMGDKGRPAEEVMRELFGKYRSGERGGEKKGRPKKPRRA
jgi:prevent-host-death family protein